jgi:hypothetical protein
LIEEDTAGERERIWRDSEWLEVQVKRQESNRHDKTRRGYRGWTGDQGRLS